MELLEFTPQFHQLITSSFIAALLLIAFIFSYNLSSMRTNCIKPTATEDKNKNKMSRKKPIAAKPPPPPEALGAWPVIGHLLLFTAKDQLTHVTLGDMADRYGPAFLMRYGSHRTLVVSGWEIAKECFSVQNDKFFSNRPVTLLSVKLMFYGSNSYGFSPYGPYWKELRKISIQKLFSHQRLDSVKHLKMVEVDATFKQLHELCNKNGDDDNGGRQLSSTTALVNMDNWLTQMMFNVTARVVNGYQSNNVGTAGATSGERFKFVVDEAMHLMGVFAFSDLVPWLVCVDQLRGLTRKMNRCGKDLDSIIGTLIEEHRQKRSLCRNKGSENEDGGHDEQDFIDVCLSLMEQSQLPGDNPEIVIKSIVLDMISGGSHTTTLALTWTLSLLLNHRHVLEKAKEEIDAHVGNERQVDDSDIPNLVYMQAILKESMRLCPPSRLFERMTMEDCEVGGFHIPAGTRLLVNVWKLQRDPSVWEDPLEFRPERFLTSKREIDVKGQHYELLPFGAGRRICPAVSFSLQVLHLVLARLIHGFEMRTPMDVQVDMRECEGLFSNKMMPLEVLITPRHHVHTSVM